MAHKIGFLLMAIGGLNWLLFGVFQWEVGMLLGGSSALLSRIIYIIIGLATVYELVSHKGRCKQCNVGNGASHQSTPAPNPQHTPTV